MAGKQRTLVRASCAKGHLTERLSDPGRLTWEGECGVDGCPERVKAKRAPKDRVPPADPGSAGSDDSGTRVIRIEEWDDTASGAPDDPGGIVVADTPAAELQAAAIEAATPESGEPDPVDRHGDAPSGLTRWRERRRAGRSARRPSEYRHPLTG